MVLNILKCVHPRSLQWRHNECYDISNHQFHDCLLTGLFRRRSKKTSKLHVTGFCVGNSPVTGEFPAQRASNTENISIWWRHHVLQYFHVPAPSKHNTSRRIAIMKYSCQLTIYLTETCWFHASLMQQTYLPSQLYLKKSKTIYVTVLSTAELTEVNISVRSKYLISLGYSLISPGGISKTHISSKYESSEIFKGIYKWYLSLYG